MAWFLITPGPWVMGFRAIQPKGEQMPAPRYTDLGLKAREELRAIVEQTADAADYMNEARSKGLHDDGLLAAACVAYVQWARDMDPDVMAIRLAVAVKMIADLQREADFTRNVIRGGRG